MTFNRIATANRVMRVLKLKYVTVYCSSRENNQTFGLLSNITLFSGEARDILLRQSRLAQF